MDNQHGKQVFLFSLALFRIMVLSGDGTLALNVDTLGDS